MSKQPRVALDPDTLKPIIEAMIFASEEPLSARALLRLLAGDRENERAADEVPPLEAMMAEAGRAGTDAAEAEPSAPEPAGAEPEETEPAVPDNDPEPAAEELPEVETTQEAVEDAPVETEPVREPAVETAIEEVVAPSEGDAGETDIPVSPELQEGIEESAGTMDAPIAAGAVATISGPVAGDEDDSSEPESPATVSGDDDRPVAETAPENAIPSDQAEPSEEEPSAERERDEEQEGDSMDIGDLVDALERAEARPLHSERREIPAVLDQAYLRAMIDELNDEYDASGRAFRIVEVAGGFQFATVREYGEFVAMLSKDKARRRLSPAALETLAILAYRQPVSKPEVEAIRGVNCDQVLLSLMEKNLIAITGRSEAVGRPLLYGTTEEFLRIFGLRGIGDLPKLREIEELMEEDAYSAERAEVITVDAATDAEEIEAKVGAAGHAHHDEEEEGMSPTDAPSETEEIEATESSSEGIGEGLSQPAPAAIEASGEDAGVSELGEAAPEQTGEEHAGEELPEGERGYEAVEEPSVQTESVADAGSAEAAEGEVRESSEPIGDIIGLDRDQPNGVAESADTEAPEPDGEIEHDIRTA